MLRIDVGAVTGLFGLLDPDLTFVVPCITTTVARAATGVPCLLQYIRDRNVDVAKREKKRLAHNKAGRVQAFQKVSFSV
jgi:hypothetical protein